MIARRPALRRALVFAAIVAAPFVLRAHSGPPFPILSDRATGPYVISIWTDPDTTDDGSPGGQFWIRIHTATGGATVPASTRARIAIEPADRTGQAQSAAADPVRGDVSNQFAALLMDREGRYVVRVTIDGPLGSASADATVEATYDLRPSRGLLWLYLVPFLLIGVLWGHLLIRRRRGV